MKPTAFKEHILQLSRIGIALTGILDLDALLDLIVKSSRELTNSDAGSLYIVKGDELTFVIAQNDTLTKQLGSEKVRQLFKPFTLPVSADSLAGYVAMTGKQLNITDVDSIPENLSYHFKKEISDTARYEIRSMLLAPIKNPENKVLGVLQLINAMDEDGKVIKFDENYEFLVNALASQAAIAIENARLTKELQNAQLDTIFRLSMATEFRESGDPLHICRTSEYSVVLAEGLKLPQEQIDLMRQAAPLHDIGKLGLPDSILKNEGILTIDEMTLMKTHVKIGVKILENPRSKILKMAASIVSTHHEKFDGSGYPNGLKNTEIPVEGRIVALADAIDAMTTPCSYRPSKNFSDISAELVQQSSKQFDPAVVQCFLDQQEKIKKIFEDWRIFVDKQGKPDWSFVISWWKSQFLK